MSIDIEIGKRIRQRREELDMSQEELAHRLGYKNKTSIAKIESGIQGLRQSKIKAIADALLTTPDYIMGWSAAGTIDDFIRDNLLRKENLADAFRKNVDQIKEKKWRSNNGKKVPEQKRVRSRKGTG